MNKEIIENLSDEKLCDLYKWVISEVDNRGKTYDFDLVAGF